jgi:hypothetical protein
MNELEGLGHEVEALRGNAFAINSDDGTIDEKILRLLNLIPTMFQVVEEARDTIARLREENEMLSNGTASEYWEILK